MKNRTVLQRRVSVDTWSSIRSSWLIISLEQKKRRKVKQQQDDDEEDDDEEPSSVDNGKCPLDDTCFVSLLTISKYRSAWIGRCSHEGLEREER